MKFRVGDEVEAITDLYGYTNKEYKWRGVVIRIWENGLIDCRTTFATASSLMSETFTRLESEYFRLYDRNCLLKQFLKSIGGSDV